MTEAECVRISDKMTNLYERGLLRERGEEWVSGDREQSFPSASLVNYIVRDPISVFTVH